VFDIPKNAGGEPERHRSSGLRDVAFDPDFANNGFVYAVYMKNNPRHNRVVRITQDPSDASRALPGSEVLLLGMPFNSSASSGSHNGAAIDFGSDGRLYVTTGDGWNGGDPVQSLATYTGKVFRINPDGSIPPDNPFAAQAPGPLRAIYALGLRNPYSMTYNAESGRLYVNDAIGGRKDAIDLVEAGANFGHQGFSGIGSDASPWANSSISGSSADKLITGGAWYPSSGGPFPAEYHGRLFVCNWGGNGSAAGVIHTIMSESDTTLEPFATNVAKPVNIRFGPDGHLYYMYTTYQTFTARIHRIRYTGEASAGTPVIDPPAGQFVGSVTVTIAAASPGDEIRYTLDGSLPTENSTLYEGPFTLTSPTVVRARSFAAGSAPSGIAESFFNVCPDISCNAAPVAITGGSKTVEVGRQTFISGSASFDPDTDEALLSDGWRQVVGPIVELLNSDETVAYFTPDATGWYRFEYFIADELSEDRDTIDVYVVPCLDAELSGVVAAWDFDEPGGDFVLERASGAFHGELDGATRTSGRTADAGTAASFDGIDDAVSLGTLDLDAGAMSIAAWVWFDDFGQQDGRIISKATGASDADHFWMLSSISSGPGHSLRGRLRTDSAGTTTLIASGTQLPAGAWTHVAMTYNGQAMRLYQNGAEIASTPVSGRVSTDPGVEAAIGNQPQRNRPFDGAIDDVLILDRALTIDELTRLASPYRPFDINRDGVVDGSDVGSFGSSPADFDGDGAADAADVACLEAFVGRTEPSAGFDPCSPADLAVPHAVLSQLDVAAFVEFFFAGDAGAGSIAEPPTVVSQLDVEGFLAAFFAGCP
ncbi:MAG: PQQ-dependent sugar dehydrogenase, partial [Planctomycetota bacterium]